MLFMLQNVAILHQLLFDTINQDDNTTSYFTDIYISTALNLHKT